MLSGVVPEPPLRRLGRVGSAGVEKGWLKYGFADDEKQFSGLGDKPYGELVDNIPLVRNVRRFTLHTPSDGNPYATRKSGEI